MTRRLPFALPAAGVALGIATSPRLLPVVLIAAILGVIRTRETVSIAILSLAVVVGTIAAMRPAPTRFEAVEPPIARYVDSIFPHRLANFARAVLFAQTAQLDPLDRINYRAVGLTHLLAISGFNIAILAGIFWLVARAALGPKPAVEYLAAIATMLYVFGIGAPESVLRAGIMATLIFIARGLGRRASILNVLCSAFFVTLLFDAHALYDIGLQLSYTATFGLIVWMPLIENLLPRRPNLLRKLAASTFAAQLMTLPLVIWHFEEFAPISFIANLALVPIFGLLFPLVVVALSGVPLIIAITEKFLTMTTAIIDGFAALPGGTISVAGPSPELLAAWGIFAIFPLLDRRRRILFSVLAIFLLGRAVATLSS